MDIISDLNGEKIVGAFHEKELQKTDQTEFRIKKVKKVIICTLCGKVIIIRLIAELMKKI